MQTVAFTIMVLVLQFLQASSNELYRVIQDRSEIDVDGELRKGQHWGQSWVESLIFFHQEIQ